MELESRRSEVLNLSLEEREVGVSHAEGLKKKKKKGLGLGLTVVSNVIFIFWALRWRYGKKSFSF